VRLAAPDANAVVLRNGVRLSADELGVQAAIDPGTYEIVARWPDKPEFRTTVTVTARKLSEVEVPNPAPKSAIIPLVVVPQSSSMAPQRIGAFVAGAVGLVGFGMAATLAISAASKNSASISIHQTCATAAACQEGKDLRGQAMSAATIANVGVGIGIVGAGTAIVLALLPKQAPTPVSKARDAWLVPWAGRDAAGAIFVGQF
jgi:hypothetical protein